MKVDIKEMLSKILRAFSDEVSFTLTSTISGTVESRCSYNPHTRIVKLSASVYSSTYWSQNTTMFTIPQEYRPKANITIPAFLMTNQPITAGFPITIYTDGTIKQAITGSCRSVYFTVEYRI